MDQQAFSRSTNAGATGFGVQHDLQDFFRVSIFIDIDVHDPFEVGKDRDTGFALYQANQTLAAARYNHVNRVGHGQHLTDCRTVACRHQLDRIRWQASRFEPDFQRCVDRAGGMKAFGPAPQDHGIAGL